MLFSLLVMALLLTLAARMPAQTLISGEVVGTVTDPSGAVVPNAAVTLKSEETSQTQTASANANGFYRFSLVKPGRYTVTATAPNFQAASRNIQVAVGQETTTNVQLGLAGTTQTVTVTAEAPVIQTENGNVSTTFTEQQIALVPNPGNDLSYIPQTAPGAAMNTQAGFGNFETFGLPGTSNLFTYNGMYENDPFLNLNNSGATNLLLGQNDVREATVVNNGYTGQYGGLAGSNVNYVSKSGTNTWHGNAVYWWNGRAMNANTWFNKQNQVSSGLANRPPFDNVNQWAGSIGGPIKKDKLFFFVDTEGLRVVLPAVRTVRVPTPQFEAATLANIPSAEVPFYTQLFNLYNNAPGAKFASPLASGGCGDLTSFTGTCASQFVSAVDNLTHEWMIIGRLDANLGSNDRAFIHFRRDVGLQATYTDPLNHTLNAQSDQPQYEGQFNESHAFSANTTNQFILSGSWYSAIFKPADLNSALTVMPFRLNFAGSAFFDAGHDLNIWPQGRNVTQYGVVDDISHTMGNHNLKFGVNFARNDVSDHDPGIGTIGNVAGESMTDFFNGVATDFSQSFVNRLSEPISLYNLGLYLQDEWKVRPSFTVTLAVRADRYSNPNCLTNCFGRLTAPFESLSHDVSQPYNQAIMSHLSKALPSLDAIQFEPRIGFAWSLFGTGHSTVVRGGVGLFTDRYPAVLVDSFESNPPLENSFTVLGSPLAPTVAGSAASGAAAANTAFLSAFSSGGTLSSITGCPVGPNMAACVAASGFVQPGIVNSVSKVHYPRYEEWNLEIQQGLGQKMSASINYVGNHGIHEIIDNPGLNAFCDATCLGTLGSTSFAGLPMAPADLRFGTVSQLTSAGISNYNGVTFSLQRKFSDLTIQASYTWSHALDEISNGGLLPWNFGENFSVLAAQDPFNLRKFNYGNADYDRRHYGSLSWVYTAPHKIGPEALTGGWVLSGTIFGRSGFPFTVVDSTATSTVENFGTFGPITAGYGGGAFIFANQTAPTDPFCSPGATNTNTPCPNPNAFTSATSGFGQQRRNQFYGPQFFDMDFAITKNFKIPGWERGRLGIGAQFFNILNHPNFDQPINDFAGGPGVFGNIQSTVSVPTSILGAFLGGDASPRLIQLKANITF